jgi:hypothetical protein
MYGREACLLNSQFVLKFGSGENEHLHIWVWCKSEEKKVKNAVMAIMDMRS